MYEADLLLGGVQVDLHMAGREAQVQEHEGAAGLGHQGGVHSFQGTLEAVALHHACIDVQQHLWNQCQGKVWERQKATSGGHCKQGVGEPEDRGACEKVL
jgi:hypothetical protein